jgi:hypothetical protein
MQVLTVLVLNFLRHLFRSTKSIICFFFQEGKKQDSGKSIATSSAVNNSTVQNSALLDSNTSDSTTGERISTPQNVILIQTEVATTKASSTNESTETKSISFIAEASKQSTDINKVPRLKDIPLPAVMEEMCPGSVSVSDAEHASHSSKDTNKNKTGLSETTPRNSQTLEQSVTQSKLETQVWISDSRIIFFFLNHVNS